MSKAKAKADAKQAAKAQAVLPDVWNYGQVFLRSEAKDGGVAYSEHRCWNVDRFISSATLAALEAGGSAEQVTEKDYNRATQR